MSLLKTLLCILILCVAVQAQQDSDLTITHEATFTVEIQYRDKKTKPFRGEFTIGLFGKVVPLTVMNFAQLIKGYKSKEQTLQYTYTPVHRVVRDFVIQMGDVTKGDGTGGMSIFGPKFDDENFDLSHRSPGWVAMANYGPDTNSSQFYILLTRARWLDGKNVVFGKVIRGYKVVQEIGELETYASTQLPVHPTKIVKCFVKELETPYQLPLENLDSTDDL